MLTVYRRGKIFWVRGGVNGIKVRESTGCRDAKAAETFRRRRERELADPHHAAAYSATVATAAERFLTEVRLEGLAPGTINMYECKVGHIVRLLGGIRLSDLVIDDVLGFIKQRKIETAVAHTIHRELTALRRTLKSAAGRGQFVRDPRSVLPKFSANYTPHSRWLTPEELNGVMAHLDEGRAAVIAFAVATAADYASLFVALRADIGTTSVQIRGTKTSSRLRSVPRVSLLEPFLKFAQKHADGTNGRLFRTWSNMPRDIEAACERAGVAKFTSRDLRRTTGTWLLHRGVPINVVAKFLGHANSTMLQKVYGQLDAGDIGRLIEAQVNVRVVYPTMASGALRADTKDRKRGRKAGGKTLGKD